MTCLRSPLPPTAATPCPSGAWRASAYRVPYTAPAQTFVPGEDATGAVDEPAEPGAGPWPAEIADPTACDRFVLREASGFDPAARTPLWMQVPLHRSGVRGVSL